MNQKTTIGLVVALIIAVGLLWWAQSTTPTETAEKTPATKNLFDPPLADLKEFEIAQSGGETQVKFVLEKDKWRMTSPVSGPAEHWTVNSDATKLQKLTYARTFSAKDPDRPSDDMTGLSAPQRIVKMVDKDGKSVVLKIGAKQALSNRTYVQKEGDETIYLVDGELAKDLKKGLTEYRGKRVCEFPDAEAVRVETTGSALYTLTKSVDNKWTIDAPAKARADGTQVANMVRAVANLNAMEYVEDNPKTLRPYGLEKPRLVVTVTTETKTEKSPPAPPASAPAQPEYETISKTYRIAFGEKAEDKVFAQMLEPASPAVFSVAEASFKQIAVGLDDLRDKSVAALEGGRLQSIKIDSGGESVTLVRKGGQWEFGAGSQSGDSQAVEAAAVEDVIKTLRELKAVGFEETVLPSFGLSKPRAVIELVFEGQMAPVKLSIGDKTPSKTGAYIRNESEGTVGVVKAESADALVLGPLSFLSRELVRVPKERCTRIQLAFPKYVTVLEKSGAKWRFAAPVQGEAEQGAVDAVLNDFASMRGKKVVGRSKDAKQFGLDAGAVQVSLTVDNPPIKKTPPASQPTSQPTVQPDEWIPQPPSTYFVTINRKDGKVYAMAGGGTTICELDTKVMDNLLAEFLDTRVTPIEPAEGQRLSIQAAESFSFEKVGDAWKLSSEPTFQTDPTKITEVFTTLNSLKAKEFVRYGGAKKSEFGLDSPAATVSADAGDGKSLTLTIANRGPDASTRYASTAAVPDRVFVLKLDDVQKLTRKLRDFQKAG